MSRKTSEWYFEHVDPETGGILANAYDPEKAVSQSGICYLQKSGLAVSGLSGHSASE